MRYPTPFDKSRARSDKADKQSMALPLERADTDTQAERVDRTPVDTDIPLPREVEPQAQVLSLSFDLQDRRLASQSDKSREQAQTG